MPSARLVARPIAAGNRTDTEGEAMTREEVQQQVDKLAQEYIARMQAAHAKQQADLQQQIEECERQQELCRKRLREVEQA